MRKKKIIILSAIPVVIVCSCLVFFVLTRDNSIPTSTNKEATNNTMDNSTNDVTENTINNEIDNTEVLTDDNSTESEEKVEQKTTEQPSNNTNNQNSNINTSTNNNTNVSTNTNTNTNIPSTPSESEDNSSQDSQGSTSNESQKPTTPSNPKVEPEVSTTNYGDVNEDSIISTTDTVLIMRYISGKQNLTKSQQLVADVNADGVIDQIDVDVLRKFIAGGYGIDKLPYNSGKKYNITYELNGGKVFTNDTLRNVYALISEIETLPTLAKDEYVFIGWTGSNSNTPELTVTPKSSLAQNLHYIANWKLYGDVNEDGIITSTDTVLITRYISGKQYLTKSQQLVADVNADGIIDDTDVDVLRKFIAGGYGIDKLPYTS